jgi:hypothetical protein
MSDKMKIEGLDGSARYLLVDNEIIDLRTHVCEKFTDSEHHVCLVCGKLKPEPNEELTDATICK